MPLSMVELHLNIGQYKSLLQKRGAGGTDRVIDSKTGEILPTQKRKRGR